ncbi:MAG: hypothetical protein KJ915_10690 [Candidatus Omnitrophica bacterium]|nr:hypothetical protein [Candidatus Omnitrophota bacterium]
MFKRIFKIIIICGFVLVLFSGKALKAEQDSYNFPVENCSGNWDKQTIEGKKVISTNVSGKIAQIDLIVPEDGYYQLYISLYHCWQEFTPFVFFKAKDIKGKRFEANVFSEPRWYLDPGQGRWEYRCISGNPYWQLSKGILSVKFWIGSRLSCWEDDNQTSVESFIAIDCFILKKINQETMSQDHVTQ